MNHIYRSVWNASTGTVAAVSENAKRGGKKAGGRSAVVSAGFILKSLAMTVALGSGSVGHASPEGAAVVAGNASITSAAGNTTINQTSQNAAINWQSFDIGSNESVRFVQPNSNAVALNRVLGSDPSSILGSLSSNGKVFLVNPNGILFGTGAQVNVGGLVASTRNIADSDFMAGRYEFSGNSAGSVVNRGAINADAGYVALLGANVSNQGVIAAKMGSVALASGNALTLDVAGDGLLNVTVNAGAVDALVHNGGLIQADGGQVLLTAGSASSLLQSAVNNSGVIQAQTIENRNGTIKLLGDMQSGTVNVAGTLDASAPDGGDGGFIDTSAALVNVASGTKVTTTAAQGLTGSWLIDPTDYTIAASGGNITGAQLSSDLAGTNIIIQSISGGTGTSGDVNVDDTVSWSANRLTLNAQNDININTAMNASGTASLALEYGQAAVAAGNTSKVNVNAPVNLPAGNNFSTLQGSNGTVINYTVITSLGAAGSTTGTDLQGMGGSLAGKYVLGSNIDAAVTSTWNAGAGFVPIGNNTTKFTGVFDGLGHTITGLYQNRTGSNPVGFFGYTSAGSTIRNVGLIGGSVASDSWGTGALVGALGGTVMNSYATGSVSGFQTAGGLVGVIDGGSIVASHATGDVVGYGNGEAGGLVGLIWGSPRGTVSNSYATGNVSSPVGNVGGLVGINWGTVTNSYATGTANGTDYIGGLIGNNSLGSISNSYATGAVNGSNNVGGLVGNNSNTISNSHATGAVHGSDSVGGLAGSNYGSLSNNHASGDVSGYAQVGGLVGDNNGTLSDSYGAGAVSGATYVGGLVGWNQEYAEIQRSYSSGAVDGSNRLGGLVGVNEGTIADSYSTSTVTSDQNQQDLFGGLVGQNSGSITTSYASGLMIVHPNNAGGLVGYDAGTVNSSYWNSETTGQSTSAAGTSLTSSQMHSVVNFAGFDFSATWLAYEGHTSPLLRSFMTPLTVTANDVTRTYNGQGYSGSGGVNYSVTPNMSNLLGTLSLTAAGINASTSAITASGLYSNQSGYIISYVAGTQTINPYAVSLTGTRVYDGTESLSAGTLSLSSLPNGETLTLTGLGSMANANVDTGKNITLGTLALGNGSGLASNYTFAGGTHTATITRATLTATATAPDKIYDGNTSASVALGLTGLVGNETLSASGAATFNSKDVVDANLVTVNDITLADGTNGGFASNYTLASGQTAVAHITARALTATATAPDKVYDGNTTANATLSGLTGLVGSETLNTTTTAAFNSKDVVAANIVTVNAITLADGTNGGLASNYTLASGQTAAARITHRVLTVEGQTVTDKMYDGTTTATLTGGSLAGVIAGETVDLNQAGAFVTADAGNDIAVTAADSLSGAAAANYIITQPTGLSADITAPVIHENPTESVSSTAGYRQAAGHVSSNAQVAPANALAVLPLSPPASSSGSPGATSYDLTGLNLTVVTSEGSVPLDMQSKDTLEEDK